MGLHVLIPPSEGKAHGGLRASTKGSLDATLGAARRTVRSALAETLTDATPALQTRVLGVRGALLERAVVATDQITRGRAPVLPAWQRYEGVVWQHLDPATLRAAQRRRILVPSALYGLTTAEDAIADYRLKFDVRLDGIGRLDDFWRRALTDAIVAFVSKGPVVNLLPAEHDRALDRGELSRRCDVVTVRFMSASGAGAAGHAAKAVKGVVARTLIQEGVGALEGFSWAGWTSRRVADGYAVRAPRGRS